MTSLDHRRFRPRAAALSFAFALLAIVLSGCSMLGPEPQQCTPARDAVKRFYSFYLDADMNEVESAMARSTYLTNELSSQLAGPKGKIDYFTASETMPRAFKVGACTSDAEDSAMLDVVLFWSDDAGNAQKEIKVEVLKRFDKWLINKVSE